MWPLLNAAAVSRSWQTRMRSPLDAATAYMHSSQLAAWVIGSVTAVVSARGAHVAECSLPAAPDRSHDHIPLHETHWYLHLDFFLGGIQPPYADDQVSDTTIPFGLLCLAEQLVPCSAPVNVLARLRLFANTVPHYTLQEKVLMLHGIEFRSRLGMGTNTLSSVYKPLHKYRIIRVSNSPHLCELCTTLMVIEQHIPLYTVSSFTKRPTLP
ncbi:hypothetical protein BHE74_00056287 [Ensete ventricosum]|nr:hypothetical protein BHE74_00056287 [Ensete ventricosum]